MHTIRQKWASMRRFAPSLGKNARLNRGAWWLGSDGGLLAGAVIFGASVMIMALDGRGLAGVAMRLCMHILSAGSFACVPYRLEALHAIRIGWRFRMQFVSAGGRFWLLADTDCMRNVLINSFACKTGPRFPLTCKMAPVSRWRREGRSRYPDASVRCNESVSRRTGRASVTLVW